MDRQQLVDSLGVGNLPVETQDKVVEEAQRRIGEAMMAGLSEQQIGEYEAIVDGNQDVIDAWLEQNMPDYRDSELFEMVEADYESDPDHVPGDKVVASVGWVQKNVPNLQTVISDVIGKMREDIQDMI